MRRIGPLAAPLYPDDIGSVITAREPLFHDGDYRSSLAQSLVDWHKAANAPEASVEACSRLQYPTTWLVTTGQQPGLLLGPMYTLIKALHAISLAQRLTSQAHGLVLPAFWVASEDHQIAEMNHAAWLGRGKQPQTYSFDDPGPETRCAWSRSSGQVDLDVLIGGVEESIPESPARTEKIQDIRDTRGGSLADWFQRLLWRWLPESGIIVLRPDQPFFQSAASRFFKSEIEDPLASTDASMRASDELQSLGIASQIHKKSDRTAFFLVEDGVRKRVYAKSDGFDIDGVPTGKDELLRIAEQRPEELSSTAILRPVLEAAVYPTIANVLGPNELAYHLQLGGIYARHDVPRPAVVPRVGLTLLELRDEAVLDDLGLTPADLREDPRAIGKHIAEARQNPALAQFRDEALQSIERYYAELEREAAAVDSTLKGPIGRQHDGARKNVKKSLELVNRRLATQDEVTTRRIEQLQHLVFPGGNLQERVLGPIHFLARHDRFVPALQALIAESEAGTHVCAVIEEDA